MDAEYDLDSAMKKMGIRYLHPYQSLAIEHILGPARDFSGVSGTEGETRRIIVLPTGYGKTICFALPALVLPHPTLIIYPLRSLISDQARRFRSWDIPTAVLVGGQSREERNHAFAEIESGRARIVLSNPELLESPGVLARMRRCRFSHIVFDEAHVIQLWGKSFRPSYSRVALLLAAIPSAQQSAFTATADRDILEGIRQGFGNVPIYQLRAPADRQEIGYEVIPSLSPAMSLRGLLQGFGSNSPIERPCLVFVRNRSACEYLSRRLRYAPGIGQVRFYHAGLSREEKTHTEAWFHASERDVLVSTNAYGMGVDKPNIRTVVHLEAPPNVADFLQESGRAGRDGRAARSIVLFNPRVLESGEAQEKVDSGMRLFLSGSSCRRKVLMDALDSPLEYCARCDVCEGRVRKWAPELDEIARFLKENSGIFKTGEIAEALHEKFAHSFGVEEFRTMLAVSRELGIIRQSRSPLSWGRLVPGR